MGVSARKDRAWLLATAIAVANKLRMCSRGTRLRIRIPRRASTTNTDGWYAIVGSLGKQQPRLEVWLDRFSGYPERKLYACLRSEVRRPITSITKHVSRKLWPVRDITPGDTDEGNFLVLAQRLGRSEFNAPILEKYHDGITFYGIYDPTRETAERVSPYFCTRAVAFFMDIVACSLPRLAAEDDQREEYPRYENRKHVRSHLQRERSRLLAAECKIRDNYKCQVCSLLFEQRYGKLGFEFAESHHRVPLSQLRENVKTRIEDLTTVCANCHRMLHRMAGKRDDMKKLKVIVRKYRS